MMQNSVGRASVGGAGGGGGPTLLSPGATPLSEDRVKVRIERDCWIMLDGEVLGERERESLFGVGNGGSNGINNGTGGGMSLLGGPDTEEDILFQQQQMQMHQLAVNTTGSNSPGVAAGAGNIWPHHPHQQHQLQHQLSPQQQQQSPLSAQHRRNNQTQIPNPPPKRRRVDSLPPGPSSTTSDDLGTAGGEWMIKKGQWRVRVQSTQNLDGKGGLEVVLCAVRIEAWRGEWGRNGDAGWLI